MITVIFGILSSFFLYFCDAGAAFLTIAPGARAVAMGSAFTALADDATASYYNPAGLAFQKEHSFVAMNSIFLPGLGEVIAEGFSGGNVPRGPEWLPGLWDGMRHLYFGGVLPVKDNHCLGFGYTYLNTGRFELYGENGTLLGEYESYDYALIVSYGLSIQNSLGIGVSLKYIRSSSMPNWLDLYYWRRRGGPFDRAFALDVGILWKSEHGLSFGASCQNAGSDSIAYLTSGTKDALPLLFRSGIAYDFCPFANLLNSVHISGLTLSNDWISDLTGESHEVWWCGGGEIVFHNSIFLRAGYFNDALMSRQGLTWGCGLKVGAIQADVATDAALYDFPTESWRFQISLRSLEWDSSRPNPAIAGISSALIPGAGQFYNGDGLKGLLAATTAFTVGEICYDDPLDEQWNVNEIILSAIHIVSIADAIHTAQSRR